MSARHTPGPWPWEYTGDGKRIIIGDGLVEGPNGYEVAEVYSDDCPQEVAEANARLIAAAPDLLSELRRLYRAYVRLLESGRDRIIDLGGDCDPVDRMEEGDPALCSARAAIARATGAA